MNLASGPSTLRLLSAVAVLSLAAGCAAATGGGPSAAPASVTSSPSSTAVTPTTAAASAATTRPSPSPTPEPIVVADGEAWIAYQGGTGGPPKIRLVRPDGTGDHPLAPSILALDQLHPDWSPDGSRIAFSADDGKATRDLWIANADGSDAVKVYDCVDPCAWSDDPAWSPDGTSILFQQGVGIGGGPDGIGVLATLDVETGDVTTVFEAAPTYYPFAPRWAPDGASIVFEDLEFASARLDEETVTAATIAVLRLKKGVASGAPRPLVSPELGARYPDWHPDGSRIVFELPIAPGASASDLWSVDAEGGNRTRLTTFADAGGRALQPTWSPDGTRLVFVGEVQIGTPVAAISAADGDDVQLVPGSEVRTHPRLRPVP